MCERKYAEADSASACRTGGRCSPAELFPRFNPSYTSTARCPVTMASTHSDWVRYINELPKSFLFMCARCQFHWSSSPRLPFVLRIFASLRLSLRATSGEDKAALEWYQQAELMHARWAMLGVAGMAAPEIFGNPFVDGPLPNWAEAPFFDGYVADANTLFVVQMFLMNWAEVRRWQDMKNPGSVHADPYDEVVMHWHRCRIPWWRRASGGHGRVKSGSTR